MSYITFEDIQARYNLTEEEINQVISYVWQNKNTIQVMNNPDISANSTLTSQILKDDKMIIRNIVQNALSHSDVLNSNEIEQLRLQAIGAVANFFAEYNKANYEDFKTDMRLDDINDVCPRSVFMSGLDEINDVVEDLILTDAANIIPDLQK